MADVQIRRGHGQAVLIGPPPAGPAGVAVVGLPGGDVHVDPAAPDEPLHTVLHDPDEAGPAVRALYGAAVAAAVREVTGPPLAAEARDGRLTADVRRLGIARWLATHSPDQLPEPLLDLEIGVAGSRPELAPEVVEDASERLRRQSELVVRLSRRLREPDAGRPPTGLPELVADAVEAAIEVVDVGTAEHQELEHEQELAAALRHLELPPTAVTWADLSALPQVGNRALEAAAHQGSRGIGQVEQVLASVDWHQVPRGVLATIENTVLATVVGPRVEVRVLAAPQAPDHPRLAFRIYAVGRPLPLARAALRRTADGRWFTGTAELPASGPREGLSVDVYDAGDPRPPRLGVNAQAARAERWSARAVSLVRLGGAGREQDGLAAAALSEAGAWYEVVAGAHTDQAHRDRARRRQARCAALRRACLVRVGQARQAAAIGRDWTVGGGVTEADLAVPDLGTPGWRPLAVERALSADPRWWR